MFNEPNDPLIQPEVDPLHASATAPTALPDPATVVARVERFAARSDDEPPFAFVAQAAHARRATAAAIGRRLLRRAAARTTRHAGGDARVDRNRFVHPRPVAA